MTSTSRRKKNLNPNKLDGTTSPFYRDCCVRVGIEDEKLRSKYFYSWRVLGNYQKLIALWKTKIFSQPCRSVCSKTARPFLLHLTTGMDWQFNSRTSFVVQTTYTTGGNVGTHLVRVHEDYKADDDVICPLPYQFIRTNPFITLHFSAILESASASLFLVCRHFYVILFFLASSFVRNRKRRKEDVRKSVMFFPFLSFKRIFYASFVTCFIFFLKWKETRVLCECVSPTVCVCSLRKGAWSMQQHNFFHPPFFFLCFEIVQSLYWIRLINQLDFFIHPSSFSSSSQILCWRSL